MRPDADPYRLPDELPAPVDDGAASHLGGRLLPSLELRSTSGRRVNVAEAARERAVFYCYPGTLTPGTPIPVEWSLTPGARGCTPQNRGYGLHHRELEMLGCQVYGVSGQGTTDPDRGLAEQRELAGRLALPFELLNDSRFELARALGLPTFEVRLDSPDFDYAGKKVHFVLQGATLLRRLTFVAERSRIVKVFYPVFPPDADASGVLAYLRQTRGGPRRRGPAREKAHGTRPLA